MLGRYMTSVPYIPTCVINYGCVATETTCDEYICGCSSTVYVALSQILNFQQAFATKARLMLDKIHKCLILGDTSSTIGWELKQISFKVLNSLFSAVIRFIISMAWSSPALAVSGKVALATLLYTTETKVQKFDWKIRILKSWRD